MDPSVLNLPVAWRDQTFVPFDYSIFAFVYQKDRLPEVPTSLEALRNLPEDVKIVIQDPRSSTPGLGLVLWVKSIYGDEAAQFWGDLKDSILTVTPGWSEAYNLFLQGEAEMVLSYTTSPAYHRIAEGDDRFAWARFAEGHQVKSRLPVVSPAAMSLSWPTTLCASLPQPASSPRFLRVTGPILSLILICQRGLRSRNGQSLLSQPIHCKPKPSAKRRWLNF